MNEPFPLWREGLGKSHELVRIGQLRSIGPCTAVCVLRWRRDSGCRSDRVGGVEGGSQNRNLTLRNYNANSAYTALWLIVARFSLRLSQRASRDYRIPIRETRARNTCPLKFRDKHP